MPKPSRTINRLHFNDLDPLRFEDLCLNLVARIQEWKELNHFGRKGSDKGVDIQATQQIDKEEFVWFIQCKRYISIGKTDFTEIIDEAAKNTPLPNKLLIIVSCDVSRTQHEYCKEYAKSKGIGEIDIWTASVLEARLYKDHKDLLFVYFGMKLQETKQDNAVRVRSSLAMEKRVKRDLIDKETMGNPKAWRTLSYEPYRKFVSHRLLVISVDDNTYPEYNDSSNWGTSFFYDTYHNGIEFWLDAGMGTTIIIDKNNNWDVIKDYDDKRKHDPQYTAIHAMTIGRIPYYNIVGYKVEGDEINQYPLLYCRYSFDGYPYEKIYYRRQGIADQEVYPLEFDPADRIK